VDLHEGPSPRLRHESRDRAGFPPDDYETLLRRVWNGRDGANSHLVRIFVRTLRRKLGQDATNPAWIFNERGAGYRMAAPGEG